MTKRVTENKQVVLTGEDANEATQKPPQEPQKKDDLSVILKGIPTDEASTYTLRVSRQSPVMFKGKKSSGYLQDFSPPFDLAIIKEQFGGGLYRIDLNKSNKFVSTHFVDIAGEPIIEIAKEEDDVLDSEKTLRRRLRLAQLKRELKELSDENTPQEDSEYPQVSQEEFTKNIARQSARMVIKYMENKQKPDDTIAKTLGAITPLITPILQAALQRPEAPFSPKDILGMVSPMMAEFVRGQSEIRKLEMTRVGEVQNIMISKALDAMKLAGAPEDEVDKVKKWLPVINEAVGVLTHGVSSILGPRRVPTQPRPKLESPKTEIPEPVTASTETATLPPEATTLKNPLQDYENIRPEEIAQLRTNQVLLVIEKEMQLGGEPDAIYDENFEKAFYMMPKEIREAILTAQDQTAILNAFTKYGDKAILDRILQNALQNKEAGIWLIDFWGVVKAVDEERRSEESEPEEDAEEGEEVPVNA